LASFWMGGFADQIVTTRLRLYGKIKRASEACSLHIRYLPGISKRFRSFTAAPSGYSRTSPMA
jgi:hypothetical protein